MDAIQSGGLLRGWLGRRAIERRGGSPAQAGSPTDIGPIYLGRRLLLDQIAQFLLDHDLEVSANNLAAAQGAFSGGNPPLARQISARLAAGDEITQAWLDEATAACTDPKGDEDIQRLVGKLESNLDTLVKTSRDARLATAEYGGQLEQHVLELDQVQDAGMVISNLAALAKAMVGRTRKLELAMRESEAKSAEMRANLEKAKRDAEIDYLTGLPNRRAFTALLERHYREAQAGIESLCVAFCDIDHFKAVNDTHGHEAGDRIIQEIGSVLAQISNDNCHVARHGGEEFVMLFRGLVPADAKARLDRAREQLAARTLINRKTDQPFGIVTFSGGVANVFAYPDTSAALDAADQALYLAKQGGRNQIIVA